MSQIRIACTALGKRIMAGKVSKSGLDFVGTPVDVTSDAIKAVIDMVGIGKTHTITMDGKPHLEIEIRTVSSPSTGQAGERE
jgi:hypothetical protein